MARRKPTTATKILKEEREEDRKMRIAYLDFCVGRENWIEEAVFKAGWEAAKAEYRIKGE